MSGPATTPGKRAQTPAQISPERWLRIQEVFEAAAACEGSARSALLDRECGDDQELRREVDSLLGGHERTGLVDRLAAQIDAPAVWRARVDAMGWEGQRVAQYTVGETLGAGGMGTVYKARDERLGRQVALKFLPPHLGAHGNAKQRFLLEARAAAALDHPNICTIHEIGETTDGQLFIAMPLYEGETLETRLDRGPVNLREAAAIAMQIADGLARAHERGVVHRDVKPANVMLLADGSVKVVDFGVARIADVSLTAQDGAAVGTIAYMSPEQARGGAVDHRSDIWSLGVLLYEMVKGIRPFRGETYQALKDSIITSDPEPVSAGRPDLPIELDELIVRTLAKAPEQRYASMQSLATALAAVIERDPAGQGAARSARDAGEASPAASGERRRVAVLVSIVADYAAMVEHLDPLDLERVISGIRDAAVEVVRRHGGLVNHAFGEEIVALFGLPSGHEDDDLRAVRAAMDLHLRVRDFNESLTASLAAPLRLQTGVHAGLLIAQRLSAGPRRYGVTGTSARLAARLAALAPADAILISPECQRLIQPFVHTQAFGSAVALEDAEPLTPYRVIGESGLQTRLEAAARKGLTPYTGRHAELATLEAQLELARAKQGQVTLVVGEAGVGKSRLLYELRQRIGMRGARVLQGRCRSYGGVAPYLPFVEILRDAVQPHAEERRAISADDFAAAIRAIDGSLEPFVPLYLHLLSIVSVRYPLPRHLQGEHLQMAILEALTAILTVLARSVPTVVLLEDWHWADEGSREAMRRVSEISAAHALLIVVTSRPPATDLAVWSEQGTRIQLGPLDYDASVAIMQGVLHVRRVSDDLARRVYERTGGNPFFLEEVCHALLEQGAVRARDGEGVAADGIETLRLPDTVQAVIRTRLDSLEKDSLEVLRVAAVIGREFAHELLVEVLGTAPDPAPCLERLKATGLVQQIAVVPQRAYRFKHVLTQEVTYDSLLGHQRRSLHGVIGRAIERHHADRVDELSDLLAHHFSHAEAWGPAVHYGSRAAARAGALSQFADALTALDRVQEWVTHLPDGEERSDMMADLLLQQERLCETLGQRGRQQQLVGELIALLAPRGASVRLAQSYLRQGDLSTLLRAFDAADRALGTALRIGRERGDAALERHALRSIGLLRWHEGRHAEALVLTENALAIDRENHDDVAVAGDLANLGVILRSMGEHERALEYLEEALETPALCQDPSKLVYNLHIVANVHRALGNLDLALVYLQRASTISRTQLLPIQSSFHLTSIAHIYLQQGRVEESLQTYGEAIDLSRRARHADGLVQSLRVLGEVLFELGRDVEALPHLTEAAQLFARLEDRAGEAEMWSRVATLQERACAAREAGETWERVRVLRRALDDARGELDALEGIARTARCRAASTSEVIPQFETALALAVALGEKRREASLRNTLGILEWESGRFARALAQYEKALGLARELGNRVHEGLTLNSLGVTLSRLDRHEEARTALEESILLNRATGERLLEAHALAALGDVCRVRGQLDVASDCFEQSLELRRIVGDHSGEQAMLQRLEQTRAAERNESMPRYIIERSVPGLTREQLNAAGRRSVAALVGLPDVRWIRSYVSDAEGKIYCEYDAPSPEAIREHARRAGLPVDRIAEVALEISPAMFV